MRLIVAGNPESASPVMAVRWCLEPKDIAMLREKEVRRPHVLMVIAHEEGGETRYLAPIDQMIEYVTFNRPGSYRLFAAIVWSGYEEPEVIRAHFLKKIDRRQYLREMLNTTRDAFRESLVKEFGAPVEIDVVVPKEHFPKEPPLWFKKIVDWGHGYPSADQCEFRRRMLLSPVKFFFAGIWAVVTTIIRACFATYDGIFLTHRDVNYRAVIHPWMNDIKDVWEVKPVGYPPSSWLLEDISENPRWPRFRGWHMFLFYPPVLTVLFAVITGVKLHYHITYLAALFLIGKVVGHVMWWMRYVLGVIVMALLAYGYIVRRRIIKNRPTTSEERARLRQEEEGRAAEVRARQYEEWYALLRCQTEPAVATLSGIPAARRTFYLRYHDLRAKACRPFPS